MFLWQFRVQINTDKILISNGGPLRAELQKILLLSEIRGHQKQHEEMSEVKVFLRSNVNFFNFLGLFFMAVVSN